MAKSRRKKNRQSAGQGRKGALKKAPAVKSQTSQAIEKAADVAVGKAGDLRTALALAESLLDRDDAGSAHEVLAAFESKYPFDNNEDTNDHNSLLALTELSRKQYAEAEEIALRGLEVSPESLDLQYAMCLAMGAMADFESAVEAGEKYLALVDSKTAMARCAGREHRVAVLIELGLAYYQAEQFDRAESLFGRAIETDPADSRPYLNLAHLYRRRNLKDKADSIIEKGLKACKQVQELRILKSALTRRKTVSACMMVKNEEELLGGCLDSIRDWVDEIIVVDTGSTDRTVQIAQSYGARIFHQPWEGDFSKHRNYSMEQATSDWIFIIDADEQICAEDLSDLFPLLEDARVKAIALNVLNVYGEKERKQVFLPSPRLFRRELNARYEGIVHNQVRIPDGSPAVRTGVRLKHYGYDLSPEKMEQKIQRSRQLLEKQLKEDPDNAFALFNLAQLLRPGLDDSPNEVGPEIIRLASKAAELTGPDTPGERHTHLMCLDQLAWAHYHLGRYDEALAYCHKALEYKNDYLDPLLLIGHIYLRQEKYDECRRGYKAYLEAQAAYNPDRETDDIILQHIDGRTIVYANLGLLAYSLKELEESRSWLVKTVELDPDFPTANGFLGRIYLQESDFAAAEKYLLKHLEVGEAVTDEPLLLANLYLNSNDMDSAERFFLQAHETDPSDLSVILKLGRLYTQTDREEDAREFFDKAAQVVGDDVGSRRYLAETLQELGRHDEAIDLYKRLLRDGHENAQILNDLGNSYFKTKRLEEAEESYLKALSYDLSPTVAHRNLGVVQANLGRKSEAVASLERYLKIHPEDGPIWRLVGDIYSQLQDFPSALERYEKYLSISPGDKMALFNLSECYLHMGHTDSAVLGYQKALELDPGFDMAQQRLLQLSEGAGKI